MVCTPIEGTPFVIAASIFLDFAPVRADSKDETGELTEAIYPNAEKYQIIDRETDPKAQIKRISLAKAVGKETAICQYMSYGESPL